LEYPNIFLSADRIRRRIRSAAPADAFTKHETAVNDCSEWVKWLAKLRPSHSVNRVASGPAAEWRWQRNVVKTMQ